ncbi:preprotein translocase subunit SecY [Candidatus Walczuchella endosymbiont of Icerya purchasi]|uniref:preprotein translocase subunit SecY n=1 Tax=Candidatus Walczuchella endosymbiont of Icerya purchasi TaxID=3066219 RepID=UPI00313B9795
MEVKFVSTLKNICKVEELRNRIIVTIFFLLVYRLVSYVPLVGINSREIGYFIENLNPSPKNIMQVLSSFTGGAFTHASVLALGIMPYISASIVIQLMEIIFPSLKREGESGIKKINDLTKWLTIGLCLIQAPAYIAALTTQFLPFSYIPKAYLLDITSYEVKFVFWLMSILLLTTGTLFSMWLGENISNKGIGNGISLIIMIGIIVRFPESIVMEIRNRMEVGNVGLFLLFVEFIIWFFIILFCIFVRQSVRKIPLQYVKSIKNYSVSIKPSIRQYIPLSVLTVGVLPIIFAHAIMLLPVILFPHIRNEELKKIVDIFQDIYGVWYNIVFVFLIISFTFFYTAITIPVNKMADDLKKNGAYIPGVKPGQDTIDYIDNILYKITFLGAIFLAIIAVLPAIVVRIGVTKGFSLFYGGTSLLIIIGVVLDMSQQINAYLLNIHYDGMMQGKISYNKK